MIMNNEYVQSVSIDFNVIFNVVLKNNRVMKKVPVQCRQAVGYNTPATVHGISKIINSEVCSYQKMMNPLSPLMLNEVYCLPFSVTVSVWVCIRQHCSQSALFIISELILLYIYWHSNKQFCQPCALNLKLLASSCAPRTSGAPLSPSDCHSPTHTPTLTAFSLSCHPTVVNRLALSCFPSPPSFPSLKVKSSNSLASALMKFRLRNW